MSHKKLNFLALFLIINSIDIIYLKKSQAQEKNPYNGTINGLTIEDNYTFLNKNNEKDTNGNIY